MRLKTSDNFSQSAKSPKINRLEQRYALELFIGARLRVPGVGREVTFRMPVRPTQTAKELYEFGPFQVDPEKETLVRDGEPVPLTTKTFQILLVLVRHGQAVVTKDD